VLLDLGKWGIIIRRFMAQSTMPDGIRLICNFKQPIDEHCTMLYNGCIQYLTETA